MNRLSGFSVVRRADENYDLESEIAFFSRPPQVGTIEYCGLDRRAWLDFRDGYRDGILDEDLLKIQVEVESSDLGYGFEILLDLEKARRVLRFCNRYNDRCEIIAVRSKLRSMALGDIESNIEIQWLGRDLLVRWRSALILDGFFSYPSKFLMVAVADCINQFGLLPINDQSALERYIKHFVKLGEVGAVEPIADRLHHLDEILIGRPVL